MRMLRLQARLGSDFLRTPSMVRPYAPPPPIVRHAE